MNLLSPDQAHTDGRHPGNTVRRGAAAVAVFVTIVGAPLVVRALAADDGVDDQPSARGAVVVTDESSSEPSQGAALDDRTDDPTATPADELDADATELDEPVDTATDSPAQTVAEDAAFSRAAADATGPDPAATAALERLEFLTASYTWGERSLRVAALQQVLDVDVDGWYSPEIRLLHLQALQLEDLGTDGVPEVPPPGPSADQWAALRDCESGGDYSIASSSGRYRGAYQFARTTWDSVAERNNPSLVGIDPASAAPADQDAMARALYSEAGHGPWPVCGRHLR